MSPPPKSDLERGQEARLFSARAHVRDVAMRLAQDGLSAETIQAAMLDMAVDASAKAAAFIARHDAEEESRANSIDKQDIADELDARAERVRGWGS